MNSTDTEKFFYGINTNIHKEINIDRKQTPNGFIFGECGNGMAFHTETENLKKNIVTGVDENE